jgi:hypothetical protein
VEQLSNAAVTTLASGITNSATTLSLTSATNFPSAGNFRLLVESEIMKVTGVSGTTLTIVRGQEGTTAVSHSSGVAVAAVLTKSAVESLLGEQFQSGLLSARPSTPREGTVWADTDSLLQYVYSSGAWNLKHPIFIPAANKIDLSAWTSVNITSSTWTVREGILNVRNTDTSGPSVKLYHRALPTAPYKINTALRIFNWNITYFNVGLSLYATGSGKLRMFQTNTTNVGQAVTVEDYNSTTSYSGSTPYVKFVYLPDIIRFQIEDDNTNWYFRYSMDGVNWILAYQCARNEFLTADKVAFTVNGGSSFGADRLVDFFGYWEG